MSEVIRHTGLLLIFIVFVVGLVLSRRTKSPAKRLGLVCPAWVCCFVVLWLTALHMFLVTGNDDFFYTATIFTALGALDMRREIVRYWAARKEGRG